MASPAITPLFLVLIVEPPANFVERPTGEDHQDE
jgi:hypothetical protein